MYATGPSELRVWSANTLGGRFDQLFRQHGTVEVGPLPDNLRPCRALVSDINGDGVPDLLTANPASQNLSGLLGNGTGIVGSATWRPARNPHLGATATSAAVADLDGDELPDVIATTDTANVIVKAGRSNGGVGGDVTFESPVPFATTASSSSDIAVGDFNGDGVLDAATANDADNTISILPGNGDGTFQAGTTHNVGATPLGLVTGDFNGDGILDIATANSGSNSVSVLLGTGSGGAGNGGFAPSSPPTFVTGNGPRAIIAVDLDGDGILDLVTADETGNSISVLIGNAASPAIGDGTFAAGVAYPVGGAGPRSLTVGDFNNDGVPDIATANASSNDASLLIGKTTGDGLGNGTFGAGTLFSAGVEPTGITVGDVNGDGVLDLLVSNALSDDIVVLTGNNRGYFPRSVVRLTPVSSNDTLATALPMASSETRVGTIGDSAADAADWSSFDVSLGQRVVIDLRGLAANADLRVADAGDQTLFTSTNAGTADESITFVATTTARLFIEVQAVSGRTPYRLSLRVGAIGSDMPTITVEQLGNLVGAAVLGSYPGALSQRRYPGAGEDVTGDADGAGSRASIEFRELLRAAGSADPTSHVTDTNGATPYGAGTPVAVPQALQSLTHAWRVEGDRRLTRVRDPALGGPDEDTGSRLKLEFRFGDRVNPGSGQDFQRAGLNLSPSTFEQQAGVIIDLPILAARSDADIAAAVSVRVYLRVRDWMRVTDMLNAALRFDDTSGDGLCNEVDPAAPAAPLSDYFARLLIKPGSPSLGFRDVVVERYRWFEILADDNGHFATELAAGTNTGPRFIVDTSDPLNRRVRVLTDRLGVFQAFIEP
ncbi:MAG: FG-GAP-like repeat-containing protein [Planctomycetota bacterium]